jgi:TolB protein
MRLTLLWILIFINHLFAVDAVIKIEKDVDERAKISIVNCSKSDLSRKVFKLFVSDFKMSAHFLPSSKENSGEFDGDGFSGALRSSQYVIKYQLTPKDGGLLLKLKLYLASNSQKRLEKNYFVASTKRYPFLVHNAVIDINAKLGYKSIDWLKRYLLYSEYRGKKESVVGIADYSFSYKKVIIKGGLNLFPIWGDKKQSIIYYTSLSGKIPTLYRLNLQNGKRSRIISSQGLLVCSDVSRDGKRLLLTMAPESQPDIFEFTLASGKKRQITKFSGIDVEAKYADGEKSIVFVSNRLGFANVFKKSLYGDDIESIVFHGKNNNSCDAFGSKVVYSSKEKGNSFGRTSFNLYLTTTTAETPRPLTSSGVNQFPRFSPDGSVIMYIKKEPKGNSIGYINLITDRSMLFPMSINRIQSIDW